MCGRFTLVTNSSTIDDHFEVDPPRDIPPQYNIAPTEPVLAVRMNTQQQREAVWLRWGFVPHWMKAEDISSKFINARADTVHQKPMFKQAFRHQRCLIPATGYFEWDQQTKPPYYFYSKNRSIMAFAGLWSHWMDQATGEVIDSCTILTGGAPESWAGIHPRMPVIMPPSTYTPWLDPQTDQTTLMRCLQQATDLTLQTHPITKKVGNPRFKSAQCLEPDA